jgi:hypothetical protein
LQKNKIKTENTSEYINLSDKQHKGNFPNLEKLNLNSPTEIQLNDESEKFKFGNDVIITEGEYKDLTGKFISYSNDEKANVLFENLPENQIQELPLNYLKKCISMNLDAEIAGKKKELSITSPAESKKESEKSSDLYFQLASDYQNTNFLNIHENSPYKTRSNDGSNENKTFYLPIEINICKKDQLNYKFIDFENLTVFYHNLQKKFGEVDEKYIFYSRLDFESYYLFQRIHNRQNCYKKLKNLINTRIQNWLPTKNKNELIGVASVAGGGKTLFLRSIPFYLKNESCLPLYITFNNSTNYNEEYDTTAEKTINSRLIHSFFDSLFPREKIEKDDIKYFKLEEIFYDFSKHINFSTPKLICHLLTLTNKKSALILVDEIKKINDSKLRNNVITHLGTVLDDMKNTNIVISTLDWKILENERTDSNRKISYIYFSPLTELYTTLDNINELKDKKFLKLRLVQTSAIPRITEDIFQKIKNKPWLIDEYNNDEDKWEKYVHNSVFTIYYDNFVNSFKEESCINYVINALNFSLAKYEVFEYTDRAKINSEDPDFLKVGDLVKFGIYIGVYPKSNRPILNTYFILNLFKFIPAGFSLLNSPNKPIYHLLQLLKFNVNPQPVKAMPDRFEECMAGLDILKRMFYYHNYNLNPKKTDTTKKKTTTYTELFGKKIFCCGEDNQEFILAPTYTLNDSFRNYISKSKDNIKHIFKEFSKKDYDLFFYKSNMFFNLKSGYAFDSVVFDPPNMITFFQDKHRKPTIEETVYNMTEIKITLEGCELVFEYIKKILKDKHKSPCKKIKADDLKWRLVFRTLKKETNYLDLLDKIKDKNRNPPNLVLIALDDLEAEFEGMFEILIQYFKIERIYDKFAPKKDEEVK